MGILRQLRNIDLYIAGVALILLLVLTIMSVVMRYVFNNPYTWLEEIQMALIVWLTFFGGSAAFRFSNHISIEILVDLLPKKIQKAVGIFIFLLVSLVIGYVSYLGYSYVARLAGMGRVTNILRIPSSLVYSAIPIGSALMLVNFWIAEARVIFGGTGAVSEKEEAAL